MDLYDGSHEKGPSDICWQRSLMSSPLIHAVWSENYTVSSFKNGISLTYQQIVYLLQSANMYDKLELHCLHMFLGPFLCDTSHINLINI